MMKRFLKRATMSILVLTVLTAPEHAVFGESSDWSTIRDSLAQEMNRSMLGLRLEDCPAPYFIGLRLTREYFWQMDWRDGDENSSERSTRQYFVPEVRVGSYEMDQSPDHWSAGTSDSAISYPQDHRQLRHHVRNALDQAYKDACGRFFEKKARRSAEGIPDYVTNDFSQEDSWRSEKDMGVDFSAIDQHLAAYGQTMRDVSIALSGEPRVLRSLARLEAKIYRQMLMNTENSLHISSQAVFSVYLSLFGRSRRGFPLHLTSMVVVRDGTSFPGRDQLMKTVRKLKEDFERLEQSAESKGIAAPCLFDSRASGALFLAFASRLEGENQRDPQEPQTFRDKLNQQVLPSFLTMTDNPSLKQFKGVDLAGHYLADEEAVPAQSVLLVEKGLLRGFLMSRRPIKNMPMKSNGHGRAAPDQRPHARAGNLIIETHVPMTLSQLKEKLIKEVQQRQLPFGLRVEGLEVIPQQDQTGSHQTFRAAPKKMFYVYPNGQEELVHHGEIVGTPINVMQSIIAAGDDAEAGNMMSTAQGGSLPVSVISPSILVSEIEVQKGSARPMRPPILPSPLEER